MSQGIKLPLFKKKRVTVAICSRESEENFQWLENILRTKRFKRRVKSVDPIYISNSFSEFQKAIEQYTFAIVYHTKKRGRINVTNVTDSLYDKELGFLHDKLGKRNVFVVIDDMERSDDNEKKRILESQTDIKNFACEMFLFTENDKKDLAEWVSTEKGQPPRLAQLKKPFKEAKSLKTKKHKRTEKKKKSK